jgi:mannose-6-phosphate isomerase-like protein (cupin superfamily)
MTLTARPFYPAAAAALAFAAAMFTAHPSAQNAALAERIVHTNSAAYRSSTGVHGGANAMAFGTLLGRGVLGPHFNFMHRGEIPVGSGIGHHFHNTADEMFVVLNGEAQFTIDGRTAVLKGPVGVVCRAGHSHAVYNSGTEPLQWINFQVSVVAGVSDAFDLGDDRVGATLDRIPTFMTMKLDRALIGAGGRGRAGAGPAAATPATPSGVMTRRAGPPSMFASTWAYVDHVLVAPGASTPSMAHDSIAEAYYVLAGSGSVTVGTETAPVGKWDAIPVRLNDTSSFKNTGTEPLELLVYGVAKDMDAKIALMKGGR